ncbi:hypothetical protein F1559_003582 [Cyanidiococcus yangmingshanensis]|uniref:Uncharacterized protein n=1 Tax=Cyanidiococcus yangmingshanensis TaxID=2690220 RepID=A0A7J7ILG6_9RHOD|nr:hypothetical protein F1559_003582 [Cyanidiococcus yangmingshanensis]
MADFLLQCFQKDAERRPSAEMLLRHPWLVKRTGELKRAETRLMGASSDSDEQEHSDGYLASRRGQSRRRRHLRPKGAGVAPREEQEPILRIPVPPPKPVVDSIAVAEALPVDELDDLPAAEDLDEEQLDLEDEFDGITLRTDERAGGDENTTQKALLMETLSAGQRGQQLTNITENDGEITPQKKEDTRMGIADADIATLARPSPEESASADSMRARHDAPATMRSVSKPAVLPETLAHFAEEAETYDDLGIDDEDWLIDELEKWRHALHTVGFSTTVDLPSSDEADSDNDDVAMPTAQGEWARGMSPIPGLPAKDAGGRSTTSALAWYNVVRPSPSVSLFSSPSFSSAESDIEAGQLGNTPAQSNALNTFAYSPSGPGYDSGGTTNDRRNDRTERKSHHSDSLPRDRYERLVWEEIGRKISALVRADLTLVDSRQRAVEAATSMLELFREVRHQRLHLVTYHLLIPLMEVLDASGIGEQALVERILEFLNEAVVSRAAATTPTTEDTLFRDHLSIAGIVPILVEFSTRAYNDRVRMQAAYLLAKMLCIEFDNDGRASCAPADPLGAESEEIRERRILPFTNESRERDLTTNTESSDIRFIETFVASRGLRAFVHLLEPDFERYREMTLIALRGVALVMRTESQRRRHDICRLLARDGFLDRLSEALEWCIEWLARKRVANEEQQPANADSPSKQRQARVIREEHIDRLAQRLVELWFLFPPADSVIEKHMARRSVLRPIVHILPALRDRRDQMNVLNSLRDLSGHQESHRALQASGAIPVLVGMLDGSMLLDGRIMITLFNLCRLRGPLETRERQEEAVCAHDGKLVRYLLHLARSGSGGGGSTTGANSGNGDRAGPKPRATRQLTTTDAVDTVATTSISGHFKGPIGQSGEHPLRGFAIEILCALDCSSERIRNVLWCNQVVEFLVGELLGSVVHWHRLRSNRELVTTSDASKVSLNRGHDADLSGYEQPEALACAHKHVERTAPASSRLGKMPHGVCFRICSPRSRRRFSNHS